MGKLATKNTRPISHFRLTRVSYGRRPLDGRDRVLLLFIKAALKQQAQREAAGRRQ